IGSVPTNFIRLAWLASAPCSPSPTTSASISVCRSAIPRATSARTFACRPRRQPSSIGGVARCLGSDVVAVPPCPPHSSRRDSSAEHIGRGDPVVQAGGHVLGQVADQVDDHQPIREHPAALHPFKAV